MGARESLIDQMFVYYPSGMICQKIAQKERMVEATIFTNVFGSERE